MGNPESIIFHVNLLWFCCTNTNTELSISIHDDYIWISGWHAASTNDIPFPGSCQWHVTVPKSPSKSGRNEFRHRSHGRRPSKLSQRLAASCGDRSVCCNLLHLVKRTDPISTGYAYLFSLRVLKSQLSALRCFLSQMIYKVSVGAVGLLQPIWSRTPVSIADLAYRQRWKFIWCPGFLIIWAKLSDIYGRKFFVLLSVLIFVIFSGACGAAQTMTQL